MRVEVDSVAVGGIEEGKMIVKLVEAGGQIHEFALGPMPCLQMFGALARDSVALPDSGQTLPINARAAFAVGPDRQPAILLKLGNLSLAAQLDPEAVGELRDDIFHYLREARKQR
jgi:hypothetical protein